MQPKSPIQAFLGFLGTGRRRAILIGMLAGAIAAGIVVPLATSGARPAPSRIFRSEGCAAAPAINRPSGDGNVWRKLAVPAETTCATLTPSARDASGIPRDASFVFTAAEPIDAAALGRRLTAQPSIAFDVRTESATRHRVVPRAPLAASTVYRFSLLDAPGGRPMVRWSFQTHGPLRVVQTLPRDESVDVPLNIGIEMTFSHDGVTGVGERFEISPKTEGRFETHKRVVVFVPKDLKPLTLYTVTLRPGVGLDGSKEKISQPFVFRFETGNEERSGDTPGQTLLEFGRATWESPTREAPVVTMYFGGGDGETVPKTAPFTVYRYAGVDAFLNGLGGFAAVPSWASYARGSYVASIKGLDRVASFPGRLQEFGDAGEYFVRFPERLPPGFYLVRTAYHGVPAQTWLQVTDVATYAAVSEGRTLVWANDLVSKKPIAGAVVRVARGTAAARTTADGTASFPTPETLVASHADERGNAAEVVGDLIVTAPDGRIAVVPLADRFAGLDAQDFRDYTFSGDPSPYWRFLYVDRGLYRLSDTIRFWGLVRARDGAARMKDVTLEMVSGYDDSGEAESVVATTVRTTARGTFLGALPFASVSPGYYELIARIGDQTIASTSFQVEDFVKPAYKIDVVPTKRAVVSGEPTRLDVTASFFEGSPVPNMDLSYEIGYDEQHSKTITTNAEGKASLPYRRVTTDIRFDEFRVSPQLEEEGEITGSASVTVYPSALSIEGDAIFTGNRVRVDGTVSAIDFDKLNAAGADEFDSDIGPPAPGRRVAGVVTEVSYRRVAEGETYDFIAKIVRKRYRYEPVRRSIGTFHATTDRRGRYSFSFGADPKNGYDIDLNVDDSAGRTATTSASPYALYDYMSTSPYLTALGEAPYAIGEQVSVLMRSGPADLPSGGANRYLFYKAARGIREASVRISPRYAFRFGRADVPNVFVVGVRFDGVTYSESGSYWAQFDQESRRLSISVTSDKARYRPGETARLAVRVTDARGRPVRAEVLLSGVDEALYRVHPDSYVLDRNILDTLYESVPTGVLHAYASHRYPRPNEGAEMGGEGEDRTDFRDVGIFTRVVTDADGRATAPFALPDNLTSWRVTTLAVTDGLEAGAASLLVPVARPVFADVTMNDSYLVSDRPLVRLRAFGSELRAGDEVEFRIEMPGLQPRPITARGTAFRPVDVALPALREGRHRLRVSVAARGRTDALVRTITVVASRLVRVEARTDELGVGERFTAPGSADGRTTVVLSDRNRGRYYPALEELSWTDGDRLDQMLARNLAQEMLGRYFSAPTLSPAAFHPATYQTEKGGLAIFPFADDDLPLSAGVAAVAADRFGRQGLIAYFSGILADVKETRERGIVALYGMAALGEPVLLDVQRAAGQKNLSLRESLYVALAALELGDEPTARALYRDALQDHGEVRGATVRVGAGVDQDDILEVTSIAATLGAGLGDDAAAAMFDYVTGNRTRDILVGLNELAFLAEALPRLPDDPSRISYTLNGKRQTRDLARGAAVVLSLTSAQRGALELEVVSGTVGVSTSHLVPFRPKDVRADPDGRITRSWDGSAARGTRRLTDGDLVRITIDYRLGAKADDGCYQVTDLLPSGLRAVVRPYDRGIEEPSITYPYAIEGQRVSFCVYKGARSQRIVYFARVVGRGTYTVEQALIQSQRAPGRVSVAPGFRTEIR